jgi:WD40 repeat protein
MRKLVFLLFVMLSGLSGMMAFAHDDIPDNCEIPGAPYYRANLFPRYEPQNRRLVLVDWTTGEDVQVIGTDLATTRIMGWSSDCRYLAVAIGESDSMDTVVFDTTNSMRMGSVTDAHRAPHPITWGPDNYLMVETRIGAVLWHISTSTQIRLTDSFDPFTARNFSRIRWDIANGQVIVNLAVGGREVYDLATGQKLELAANTSNSEDDGYLYPSRISGSIVLGGKAYTCTNSYYGYRVHGIYTHFDYTTQSLALVLYPNETYAKYETIQMVDDNVSASWFRQRGWSSDCRYLAASLGIPGRNASNTVVWDIVENRRVGMFEDAQVIVHPLHWSSSGSSLIVETRDGAYLWHLPTNTRTLLTADVQTALAGQTSIQTFTKIRWTADRLYTVEIDEPEIMKVYDSRTGQFLESFQAKEFREEIPTTRATEPPFIGTPGTGTPVNAQSGYSTYRWRYGNSGCKDRVEAVYDEAAREIVLRITPTGEQRILIENLNEANYLAFSPDCRYLTAEVSLASNEQLPYDISPLDDTVYYDKSETFLIWDVNTGEQVAALPHPFRYQTYSYVRWSPGGEYALIRLTSGHYIVEPATRRVEFLTFQNSEINVYANQSASCTSLSTYWDFERGQVLIGGWTAVHAFDLFTGEERGRFTANPDPNYYYSWFYGCVYSLSEDRKMLFVESGSAVGIWNLNTYEHVHVDVDPYGSSFPGQLAISPDGRYFVIARSMVRVWDLTSLPEKLQDRDPVYRYTGPFGRVRRCRFIDEVTVELVTRHEGTYHLNVTTGELTPVT